MEIPTTKKLNDAERFVAGLELLAKECNLYRVKYTQMGVTLFSFGDGSSVGGLTAWRCANII